MGDDCAICLDSGGDADAWTTTPCKHRFHKECLNKIPADYRRCPLCRQPLDPVEDSSDSESDQEDWDLPYVAPPPIVDGEEGPMLRIYARNYNMLHVSHGVLGIPFAS